MPRAVRNAAASVDAAADNMSAAVINVCTWLAVLAQRVSERGIDVGVRRAEDGQWKVNVSVPQLKLNQTEED